jgi:hypothetical protein
VSLPAARIELVPILLSLLLITPFAGTATADTGDLLLPVSYDAETGRVRLEVRPGEQMIYTNTLAAGLGTTSPLLDRGQIGDSALVRFERHGPKVLLIRENTDHRAITDNRALQRSVTESFPESVLAAMEIENSAGGVLVVDATDFFLSDVFGVGERIRGAGLGKPSLDNARSYIDGQFTGAFPENAEIRAVLSFAVDEPSTVLRRHAPDGRSVTVQQHHSFLALPDDDYRPRAFHPRGGIFPHIFFDFALGHDTDYRQRWIWRWRLLPSDPDAYLAGELVEPIEPIVYYMDPAIPEPYRSTFIEGGLWWNQALEAAGFKNAFQIRDLPEGADPMDARYNMIHWVHRRERGPSIGPHYRDPRTGEIVRAIVRMDSYRSLVNHDIWMGFRPAAGPESLAMDSEGMAMARRLQHTAHEIGHTLGLAHNFIGATQDRASVMDYPVPLARLDEDGNIDISEAYAPSFGANDELAIRYAYTWFPDEEAEREGLAAIIREFDERGLRFITGGDARPAGSFPDATTWVEGENMLDALRRTLAVRETLIERFDDRALNPGEPYALLNKRFAHVYLHHRTALTGATKHIGGMEFAYALKGDAMPPTRRISAEEQREALDLVLTALRPEHLRIPDRVGQLIPPVPFGWDAGWGWHVDEQLIGSPAGPAFDTTWAAHSLAQEIVDGLFHPERMARVASFHARDPGLPSVGEVLDTVLSRTWGRDQRRGDDPQDMLLHHLAQRAVLDGMLDLAGHGTAPAALRSAVEARLKRLRESIEEPRLPWGRPDDELRAHHATARRDIDRYFAGEDAPGKRPRPAPIPLPWP